MNNVSTDEVLKRTFSTVENGSIEKNSSRSSNDTNSRSAMSKDLTAINNNNSTDNHTEDGEGSEAETVVLPGKDLDTVTSKKMIRHEGNHINGEDGSKSTNTNGPNGSSTKPSRSNRQVQEGTTSNDKKHDKKDLTDSINNSPSISSPSHDQQEQQHRSRSRATSESTRSRQDHSENSKSATGSSTVSRKRKVSVDASEDKSVKRRIKREENDAIGSSDSKKTASNARSESPSRQRSSTISSNSPSVQKPRRKPPPPSLVGVGPTGRRKPSVDGDSNESQSPRHSTHPKLVHATDSEMLKRRRDKNGRTRVARACAANNLEEVREHLKEHPEELDEPDNAGNTPLQIASLEGNTDIVKLLLKKGCKVDTENCDRDSPLIDSVENSHLAVVRLLLEAGVNPRKVNAKGEEPGDLVDMDHEDGPAIKEELTKYRLKYESKRKQTTDRAPDTGRESVSAKSPRGSPSMGARSPPPQTTRRRAGRSEATRNDLLWITATPENLVQFAGKGDDQAIIHLLNMRPVSDTEAVYAAAKGGHESCLNLLLAMGETVPDPAPLEDQKKGYNTPMLAAIGKGTLRIVELLLEQPGFDPTKRLYKNQTYYEIAEKRQGDGWREEYRKLKTAYDNHVGRDAKKGPNKPSRTSSPKDAKKAQKEHSPSAITVREASPAASRNGVPRKKLASETKPERPREKPRDQENDVKPDRKHLKVPKYESREGSNAISDREASPAVEREKRSLSDQEAIPKPRKRLVSGRDLKDAQVKQRRSSLVSTVSTSSTPESVKLKSSPEESSKTKRLEPDEKKEKKKSRRSISPQPSDALKSSNTTTKRPRINSDGVAPKSTTGPTKSSNLSRNTQSSGSAPIANMGSSVSEKKESKSSNKDSSGATGSKEKTIKTDPEERLKVKTKERVPKSETTKADSEKRKLKEPKSSDDTSRLSQIQEDSDVTSDIVNVSKIKQEAVESPVKEVPPEVKQKEVVSRSISPDHSAVIEDDLETAPTESESVMEAEKAADQPKPDQGDTMHAAVDPPNERKRSREPDEAFEEAERHKRLREDEENIKKQAAQEQKEKEARQQYLDCLPKVFRNMLENPEEARKPQEIRTWLPLLCATGREVDSTCPEGLVEDLWITNFQVAAILVESDLEMSRHTSWIRKPLIDPLKSIVWRNMKSTVHRWSITDSADILNGNHTIESYDAFVICETKFLALDLFWIRLSDFEDVVSQYPHLQGFKWHIRKLSPVSAYQDVAKKIEEAEKRTTVNSAWAQLLTPRTTQSPSQPTETLPFGKDS